MPDKACVLCGSQQKEEDGTCKSCEAKEYAFWGIPLGYIYAVEYKEIKKKIIAIFTILLFFALLAAVEFAYYQYQITMLGA